METTVITGISFCSFSLRIRASSKKQRKVRQNEIQSNNIYVDLKLWLQLSGNGENAIHRINHYPVEKSLQSKPRYPLESFLYMRWIPLIIHLSNNPSQVNENEYFLYHHVTCMCEEDVELEMITKWSRSSSNTLYFLFKEAGAFECFSIIKL